MVRVWEVNAPKHTTPLEWFLLCDGDFTAPTVALNCALQYAARWLCEEFHKALKTGLQVEALQLHTGEALMATTALKSLVALRLLELRERVQQQPTAPAAVFGLNRDELLVLEEASGRTVTTVQDVALALAHLGGHLNRTRDGLPGWQTLWRGWLYLQNLLAGVYLAQRLKKFR